MEIVIKVIKVFGNKTESFYDFLGMTYLYPTGTKRMVKVLDLPLFKLNNTKDYLFKIINKKQESKIDWVCNYDGVIHFNKWR